MDEKIEAAWRALEALEPRALAELMAEQGRLSSLSGKIAWQARAEQRFLHIDHSKTHLDDRLLDGFEQLAQACGFDRWRATLLSGEIVNPSEQRAAEHTAQRGTGKPASVEEAAALHRRMRALVEAISEGLLGKVRHCIHIGIGGSALGPALAIDALTRDLALMDVHVVSNIDGLALESAMARCDPEATIIALASKTFTTVETLVNGASALEWLRAGGVSDPYGRVIAMTAAPERAVEWGVDETRILPFPETVGGRYSLWSSIGFPIALAAGWDDFAAMLEGARAVDQHFAAAHGRDNLCLRAAFADQYYARLRGCETRAVFCYDERLRLFPAYLQQLEMESNGKRVTIAGEPVTRATAPVTWGGVGTDAQHAVFQLLHQGTRLVPVDFLASIAPGDGLDPAHHRILLANCLAQGAALMAGGNMGEDGRDPFRAFPGDRPSTTLLCDDIDAAMLGALIAFHEHRTFANAVLMQVNPFDQFGVELGKKMARELEGGKGRFDAGTEALMELAGLR